jgi:hypothetical protein
MEQQPLDTEQLHELRTNYTARLSSYLKQYTNHVKDVHGGLEATSCHTCKNILSRIGVCKSNLDDVQYQLDKLNYNPRTQKENLTDPESSQ